MLYSGAIAGAREALFCGVPALCLSMDWKADVSSENDWKEAVDICLPLITAAIRDIEQGSFPKSCLLNIEIPISPSTNKGFRVTKQSLWRSGLSWRAISSYKHTSAMNFMANQQSLGIQLAQLGRDASAAGAARRVPTHRKNVEIESVGAAGKQNSSQTTRKHFRLEFSEQDADITDEDLDLKAVQSGFVAITPLAISAVLQSETHSSVSNWLSSSVLEEMAVAQLTNTSALAFKSVPSFEGLRSAKGFSNANVSLLYPSFATWSFRGLITCATLVSSAKYTSIKPLGDRVLIKIKTVEEKTSSGIFLPSSSQNKQQSGEVVAVGAGKRVGDGRIPIAVETGKEVVYSKYVGTEVEVDGSSHLILKEDDIIGILESDDVKDLKPLNDRVLIKVAEAEGKTSGGLLLSKSAKERPSFGTVVAAGPGLLDEDGTRKPLSVSPGNTVLYSKYAGNDLKGADGSDYITLRVHAIMGKNGSGKSTFSKVLVGHPEYEVSGTVTFKGQNLLEMEPEERSLSGIFMSFQSPVEIPGVSNSEFLNMAYNARQRKLGLPELGVIEFFHHVYSKLQMVNMKEDFLNRNVNEGFSGGERKRNEILQLAVLGADLAILDEIDSGLDVDALQDVAKAVNALLTPNNSVLMITHYQRLLDFIKPSFIHIMKWQSHSSLALPL